MSRKSITAIVAVALAAFMVTAVAFAAPARTVKMGNGVYTQKWEGTGSGALLVQNTMDEAGCQPGIHDCDDTLIEVTEAGTLTVKTTDSPTPGCSSPAGPTCDTDLQLFNSNAQGEAKDELQESAQSSITSNEQVSVKVKAGFYIARIDYAACAQCTVPAEASLKPSAAGPAPAPGPGTTPNPAQDAPPSVTAAKPGSKKVKAFKGTAADKEGVAKVEVGIIQLGKKGKCKDVAANGKLKAHKGQCTQPGVWLAAKGTNTWTFTLKKPLPKGKYVLFARATDTAGQTQGGFGPANRKAFTVKK